MWCAEGILSGIKQTPFCHGGGDFAAAAATARHVATSLLVAAGGGVSGQPRTIPIVRIHRSKLESRDGARSENLGGQVVMRRAAAAR